MNNGLKVLLIAASTIITCMVVSMGFLFAKQAKQIGNGLWQDLEEYQGRMSERNITKYDGVTVLGGDVLNFIKLELPQNKDFFHVTVCSDDMTLVLYTSEDWERCTEQIQIQDSYKGKVIRNKNRVIEEMRFTKLETYEGN